MTREELETFRAWSDAEYAQEHVRAGDWDPSGAQQRAEAEMATLLPQGVDTPDHFLRVILDDATGGTVGEVWYNLQRKPGGNQLFLYWIGIDEKHRGRGFGSEVLRLLEREAQLSGAKKIALHVFAHNPRAVALYERHGYAFTNLLMAKTLG